VDAGFSKKNVEDEYAVGTDAGDEDGDSVFYPDDDYEEDELQ